MVRVLEPYAVKTASTVLREVFLITKKKLSLNFNFIPYILTPYPSYSLPAGRRKEEGALLHLHLSCFAGPPPPPPAVFRRKTGPAGAGPLLLLLCRSRRKMIGSLFLF